LRMMCEYVGADYTDKQYTDFGKWFKEDKPALLKKNPLINLPYLVDGDTVVTQSCAVYQYFGRRYGLDKCSSEEEKNKLEQVTLEVFDLRNTMIELVYPFKKVNRDEAEYSNSRKEQMKKAATTYAKLEAWLTHYNTTYLCGATPMTPDFHFWEMMDQHEILAKTFDAPSPLAEFPKCKALYDAFRSLPALQKYFESEAYKLPINNQGANAYFA